MEYRVQQKAIVWYETTVEADSPEQAVELIQEGSIDLDWESQIDYVDFQDYYWWQNPETKEEGEIDGSKI